MEASEAIEALCEHPAVELAEAAAKAKIALDAEYGSDEDEGGREESILKEEEEEERSRMLSVEVLSRGEIIAWAKERIRPGVTASKWSGRGSELGSTLEVSDPNPIP